MMRKHTLRTMVLCASLFFNLTLLASAQEPVCIDMPNKFLPQDLTYTGNKQLCKWFAENNWCGDSKVLEKCCLACTKSDTSDTCIDVTNKFLPEGTAYTGAKKPCSFYKNNNLCGDTKVKSKCCVSCPNPTDPPTNPPVKVINDDCNDAAAPFRVKALKAFNRRKKPCRYWANKNHCDNTKVKKFCCVSCPNPTDPPTNPPVEASCVNTKGKIDVGLKKWTCNKIGKFPPKKKKRICNK